MPNVKLIKIALLEKELTCGEAARQVGLGSADFSSLIHGAKKLNAYRVRLAELLGVPLTDIFPDGLVDNRRRRSAS